MKPIIYLTLTEAAEKYTQLTLPRLRQLCQTGRIEAHKRTARLWLLSEKSLQAYLASNRTPGPKRLSAS